jgi:hypothetical protein
MSELAALPSSPNVRRLRYGGSWAVELVGSVKQVGNMLRQHPVCGQDTQSDGQQAARRPKVPLVRTKGPDAALPARRGKLG